ncbi:MAG: hypothetical protein RI897_2079 [Verrucomicrobiota bacterium]
MAISVIQPTELAQRLKKPGPPLLLDVREPDEVAFASIEGSKHIPLRDLPGRLGELEFWRDREVVVMCHHGMRSMRAAQFLQQSGFESVANLTGGIDRWSLEVDPEVRRF